MDAAQLTKPTANPRIPRFGPGDTVKVNFRIREGERERIQAFQGVVIRLQNGTGPAANFTVRRISSGIGIERIFPIYSPLVESLEVTRYGSVRRAKLYYLRGLQGRAARIKEKSPLQRRKASQPTQAAVDAEAAALAALAAEAEQEPPVDEDQLGDDSAELTQESESAAEDQPVDELEIPAEEGPEQGPPEDPEANE